MINKRSAFIILITIILVPQSVFAQTPQSPDINNDGMVDILDVIPVVNNFNRDFGFPPRVDLNNDGNIDILDILVIVNNWGRVQNPPTITSISATPITLNPGDSSILTWSVTGADSLTLNPGNIDVTGLMQKTVNPADTTIYTLKASNSGGNKFDSVTIRVSENSGSPIINSFTATPSRIDPSGSSTLTWDVDDEDSIEMVDKYDDGTGSDGVTDLTQLDVNPTGTTSYLLKASNSNGDSYAMATVSTSSVPSTLKYFTYFGSEFIGGCDGTPCVLEVADHSNVIHVYATPTNPGSLANIFRLAAENNVKVIVDVRYFFYPGWTYNPNYQQNWDNFVDFIHQGRYESQILAFYNVDEIFFYFGYSQHANIAAINSMIKESFPSIPIATFFGPHMGTNPTIPQGFDWLGIGCYVMTTAQSWDNCEGLGKPVDYYVDIIRDVKTSHQKILLVPDGQYFIDEELIARDEMYKLDIVNKYYDMANNDPEIIGMLPYLWASYIDERDRIYRGTRNMSLMQTRYKEIGREISGK